MRKGYITLLLAVVIILYIAVTAMLISQKNITQNTTKVPVNTMETKTLTVYTTLPSSLTTIIANEYNKNHKVKVVFMNVTSDYIEDHLKDSQGFPKGDMIIGDSKALTELAKAGKLEPRTSEHGDWVKPVFKGKDDEWIGIWYDPVVFCYNLDYMKSNWNIANTWEGVAKAPKLRIATTDFIAASAASNILYSLVEDRGVESTMKLLKGIHPKVVRYAKYLSTPVRMVGMGEADMAIAMQSEVLKYRNEKYPITIVYPQDGTAYLLTGAGILKGSKEQGAAVEFTNWLLGDEVQIALQNNQYYFIPTNYTTLASEKFAVTKINLLKRNIILDEKAKEDILNKWVKEVRLNN